jgi:RNA polymerase sigma-70 factor (ECF subfamily)
LSGWLTTVVSRVCLDMLRSRRSRREEPLELDEEPVGEIGRAPDTADPEREAMLAESVGLAMQAVVQRLAPAERVAFVLHDVFGVSFDEIAEIVDRSPVAARQLASRGRRRVQGTSEAGRAEDLSRHQEIVKAFFRASRDGDFQALLAVLDPDVALRPDAAALAMGARTGWITSELRGPEAVATRFSGNAQAAQVALLDGVPGGVWAANGKPVVAFAFTVRDGKVADIELIADSERLGRMNIELLP